MTMKPWSDALLGALALLGLASGCSQALGLDDDFRLTPGNGGAGATATGTGADGGGGSSTGGEGGGGNGGAGGGNDIGCADGTREAYANIAQEPNIAGCSGGWSIAGVVTPASMQPQCGRESGNDSNNPNGTGCTVADLCAEGWHVCESAADVAMSASSNGCPSDAGNDRFFGTRQPADMGGNPVCTATGINDVHGCGALGIDADATCAPLTHRMRVGICNNSSVWACGTTAPAADEGELVTKSGPSEGGMLCCRDL